MLSPREAYRRAKIEGPLEYTRNVVLSSPIYSYYYARDVDKSPRDDTRKAVLFSATYSYHYARDVDKIIFIDSNYYLYFVDIHNIGMRWIRESKYNIGFVSIGCFCLDVL